MARYTHSYLGLDRGRESSWDSDFWLGVLRILSRHAGENLRDLNSPVFSDLEREFPDDAWKRDGNDGSFFRDYPYAWTSTGVLVPLRESDGQIRVTTLGADVLASRITQREVFLRAMRTHTEQGDGFELNPFQVLATAFRTAQTPLHPGQIYNVMKNYLPGVDSLPPILRMAHTPSALIPPVSRRRLNHILRLMAIVGGIEFKNGVWKAANDSILLELSNSPMPRATGGQTGTRSTTTRQLANGQVAAEAEQELEDEGEFHAANIQDARKRVMASIVRRRGQKAFRTKVLNAYGGRCAISGYNATEAVDAAHLVAYLGPETNHIQNGLPLRCDIHNLWDLGLITVDTVDMTILVSETLSETPYADLHGQPLLAPIEAAHAPSTEALNTHRAESGL